MAVSVVRLSVTPIKGTRLHEVDAVSLERGGARGNRRFFVIDERDRMVNAKTVGELQTVVASFDEAGDVLTLALPSGETVTEAVGRGEEIETRFFSRVRPARVVLGPFSSALSRALGRPLRLVEDRSGAVDRGQGGGASLISSASLARLARQADADSIDPRRFRMLIEVDGLAAHEEDSWVGRSVAVGGAEIRFGGHVGRCLITSRDPDNGEIDLPTLDLLGEYRRGVQSTEPLPFGVYGAVASPGRVAVGDSVTVSPR